MVTQMKMTSQEAHDVLACAREASHRGEDAEALENYVLFFAHALDDPGSGLQGVRLSYCLAEWARLGRRHPPALERLRQEQDASLQRLEESRDPRHFHDFQCINHYLRKYHDIPDPSLQKFMEYHASDFDLARSIVWHVWDELIAAEEWGVCAAYLEDPNARYDVELNLFDKKNQLCRESPEVYDDIFRLQTQRKYVQRTGSIVRVLRHSSREDEAERLLSRVETDVRQRGDAQLFDQVRAYAE